MKTINPQIQGAQQRVNRINTEKSTPRHIMIKLLKTSDKEKIGQAGRKKNGVTYRGTKIRFSDDVSLKTMQARTKQNGI